jgi:hypothetical protein
MSKPQPKAENEKKDVYIARGTVHLNEMVPNKRTGKLRKNRRIFLAGQVVPAEYLKSEDKIEALIEKGWLRRKGEKLVEEDVPPVNACTGKGHETLVLRPGDRSEAPDPGQGEP